MATALMKTAARILMVQGAKEMSHISHTTAPACTIMYLHSVAPKLACQVTVHVHHPGVVLLLQLSAPSATVLKSQTPECNESSLVQW